MSKPDKQIISNYITMKLSNQNFNEDNISDEFLILEHIESDEFEYRNGLVSFKLSEKKLKQMANSFKSKDRELYISYDHEANGSSLAAGWFKSIRASKTENGVGLFATAEWTPRAIDHIKNKEYFYFSVECRIEGMVIKSGEDILFDPKIKKSILTGGALTNNPFFTTTNLSLSNGNINMENDIMSEYANINAELEQLKADKEAEMLKLNEQIALFKSNIELKDAEILKLSNEIKTIKKENKDAMIASFLNKLPEDAEKRETIKVKLEKLSEKLENIEFAEMAELIIAQNDKRINPLNADIEFGNLNNNSLSLLAWDDFIQETKNELKK